jgi:hypothetical protein
MLGVEIKSLTDDDKCLSVKKKMCVVFSTEKLLMLLT